MSNKVEIYDDSESISVSDIAVYSLDINDITSGGTISISSAVNLLENQGTITATPEIAEVTISPTTTVKVEVNIESSNSVNIAIGSPNEVLITDNVAFPVGIAFGPQGVTGEQGIQGIQGATGSQGPAGIGSFPELTDNPFTVVGNNVGLHITNPQYELHLSESLFAPLVASSKIEIKGALDSLGDPDGPLFIVKSYDTNDAKFVINIEGVTMLGQFEITPTPVDGGMFYSSSGDFYLGS